VRQRWEGWVLKDPTAPYAFGRTTYVQKVKLAGPDVNAGVIGVGFSLNANPRRWGLVTAVGGPDQVQYYCRTEVLVGDALHRAFGIVFALDSRVRVSDVLDAARKGGVVVCQGERSVRVEAAVAGSDVRLTWRKGTANEGTLSIPRAALGADVQWLCSPWECPFTLSLYGDLRPLDGGEPRHPRGRVEFYEDGTLPVWDTAEHIRAKFDDAAALDRFCIERATLQRIQRLRALPPKRETLREMRKIVQAWMRHYDEPTPLEWPQAPPSYEVTNAGLNAELGHARDLLLRKLTAASPKLRPLIESALRPLEVTEGEALFNLPPPSQWAVWDRRRRAKDDEATLPSQEAVEWHAHAAQLKAQLIDRLQTLKAAVGKGLIRWPRHTHGSAYTALVADEEEAPIGL
jgi:hypothetical protein